MAYAYLLFIQVLGIWLVLGSKDIRYRTKQHHGLNDLVHDFSNIIQKPAAKFIDLNLDFEDAFDREASGVYKLIPYYMKIYPKDTNHGDRFIIQQNPFNGEFQLVKIFNYIYRKNVRSLFHPNKEIPQKRDLTTINSLQKYQANVKALAEKNITLIEEIQNTKKQSNTLKENLQSKEKNLYKDVEQEKRKMKEKKLKLKEEIFQLKLQNTENEQKLHDLQQTLEPKESLIDKQKTVIEKLQLELSQLKYEKGCLKDENLNLTNQLKTAKENLNQEKYKSKTLEKQEKYMHKTNQRTEKLFVKMQKMHDEHSSELSNSKNKIKANEKITEMKEDHVSKLLHLELNCKELEASKKTLKCFESYLENYYCNFTRLFPDTFLNLSAERQFHLERLFKNEQLEYTPNFEYEHALMAYGFFKHIENFRINGIINVPEEAIFDPKKLELDINLMTIKMNTI